MKQRRKAIFILLLLLLQANLFPQLLWEQTCCSVHNSDLFLTHFCCPKLESQLGPTGLGWVESSQAIAKSIDTHQQRRPDFSYFLHPLPIQGTLLFSLHSRCLLYFYFPITGSSCNFSCYQPKGQILIFSNVRPKVGESVSKVSVENSNIKLSSIYFPNRGAHVCMHVRARACTRKLFHLQWWGWEALKKCHFYTDSGVFV